MRAQRSTPRRSPGRDDHGHGVETGRAETFARARGGCEVAGPGCTGTATDWHHRLTRKFGPDCPCNALAACSHCHHANVHESPAVARDAGWIVSKHSRATPAETPVQVVRLGIVLLTCDGSYLSLDGRTLV